MSSMAEDLLRECPPLDQVIRQIDEIFTLPHLALRIMEVVSDESNDASGICNVMEGDPALCARVLRCVNSSAYGLRAKITNLQQAITFLGRRQVRNLAMAAGVSGMFKKEGNIGPYRRWNLWKHLVSVGICSRLIAMRLGFVNFEDVFLAGLLHDIGIILEDQYVHRSFVKMILGLDQSKTLVENEHAVLGFDHTQLGRKVAANWHFPEGIQEVIYYHHVSTDYEGENLNLVRCVALADLICSLKGISAIGIQLDKPSSAAIQNLELSKEDLVVLSQDLDRELEENAALLQIGADSIEESSC